MRYMQMQRAGYVLCGALVLLCSLFNLSILSEKEDVHVKKSLELLVIRVALWTYVVLNT